MGWRKVVEEFEADVRSTRGFFRRGVGEVERKTFQDGEEELEIHLHRLPIPSGDAVTLAISDRWETSSHVSDGRVRIELSKNRGDEVPTVRNRDTFEVRAGGEVIARGIFRPD